MSSPDSPTATFTANTTPMTEVATMDNLPQASAPMSVTYILNSSEPLLGKEPQDPPPISTAPVPSTTTIAPVAPGGYADNAMTPMTSVIAMNEATNGAASPVPSAGDASADITRNVPVNRAAESSDVEMKTEDNAGGSAPAPGEFRCMNDEFEVCRTGQTRVDLSRKVISDHFGRNKACTRLITDWPLFCRKHYQRATYNQKLWQSRKITLILRQFNIIEAQFSGTMYTVALKKSEEQRLNTFSRKLAAGKTELEAAALVAPAEKAKHFEAPVNVLREIEQLNYLGENKTKAEVEAAINTISDMLESGDTSQVPSIEFLPQLDASGNPYDTDDCGKATKKSSARVSKKGAITKPSSNKKKTLKKKTPKKSASKA